jgi:hypothetical protein
MPTQHLPLQRAKRASGCAGLTCGRAYGAWSIGATANVEFRWFILIEPTPQPRAAALHDSGVMNTAEVNPNRDAKLAAVIPSLARRVSSLQMTTAEDGCAPWFWNDEHRRDQPNPSRGNPELCHTSFVIRRLQPEGVAGQHGRGILPQASRLYSLEVGF